MFSEYDAVVAVTRLSDHVEEGTRGTVLLVLDKDEHVYEIEFVDQQGDSIELLTVRGDSIRRL